MTQEAYKLIYRDIALDRNSSNAQLQLAQMKDADGAISEALIHFQRGRELIELQGPQDRSTPNALVKACSDAILRAFSCGSMA